MLWNLERATIPTEAVRAGVWPTHLHTRITWGVALLLAIALWPMHGVWALLLGPVLGRLVALDGCHYLLPNLYTIPLMTLGVLIHPSWSVVATIGLVVLVREVVLRLPKPIGISGGDFMLLAAMLAWLLPQDVFLAMGLGCILWLPMVWRQPTQPVPLGVPMIFGWAVLSLLGGLLSGL